jgi:hypothetical protein
VLLPFDANTSVAGATDCASSRIPPAAIRKIVSVPREPHMGLAQTQFRICSVIAGLTWFRNIGGGILLSRILPQSSRNPLSVFPWSFVSRHPVKTKRPGDFLLALVVPQIVSIATQLNCTHYQEQPDVDPQLMHR